MPVTVSVVEAPPVSADAPMAGFRGAAQAAMPAVVSVIAQRATPSNPHADDPFLRRFFGDGELQPPPGLGSGVIVSPEGYLLTNHHVIANASEVDVRLADGREVPATLVGTDPETDIAVLKIDLAALPVVALGDIDTLRVGDPVLAIGNPFNVGLTATAGIVSALGRNRLGLSTFENFIQTDAAINPGNSGGALVDARGALVGINTAIYSRSGGSLGIGFAVPVDLAREVMEALVAQGRVIRGWIGVEPQELTPELASTLGMSERTGVLITAVLQDGPAATAGVRPGDVVVSIDGKPVDTPAGLLRIVAALQPMKKTRLELRRNDHVLALDLTVGERPAPQTPR
jgi:Do/DeqQ family serine protease